MPLEKTDTLADDLIWGAENIARFIGHTPRQTLETLRKGELPGAKINKRWVASKTAIRARLGVDRGAA